MKTTFTKPSCKLTNEIQKPEPTVIHKFKNEAVIKIHRLIGSNVVLLNVPHKKKSPSLRGWQKLQVADCTPEYLERLKENIGVRLGDASGGLYAIDIDNDNCFSEFIKLNPLLEDTLHSHARRGGQIFVRIKGEAIKPGVIKAEGAAVGEWRGNGNQSIIHGIHPEGMAYNNNGKAVIEITLEDLNWPDGWVPPWEKKQSSLKTDPRGEKDNTGIRDALDLRAVKGMLWSIPKERPDRDLWMKVAASVRNSLGNDAVAIALLKAHWPEEEEGEYQTLLKSAFSEISFGTLRHYAGEHGFIGFTRLFYTDGKGHWMESLGGDFISIPSCAVRQHLTQWGVPKNRIDGVQCEIRDYSTVDLVIRIAGIPRGIHAVEGNRILIPKSPEIIPSAPGTSKVIMDFVESLLGDVEQLTACLNLLAHARRAILEGKRRQTPVLAIVGGPGSGKSLFIEIINRSLTGVSAKPYKALAGDNNFNADLCGAALLVIDDAAASHRHTARRALAQNIKESLFTPTFRVEGKRKDAIGCSPVHFLVMATNAEPEHLLTLPTLDDSMRDKITILKAKQADFSAWGATEAEKRRTIELHLPAFLHQLETMDLTAAYDERGRLKCFWNPEVVEDVEGISNEVKLWSLIQVMGFGDELKNEGGVNRPIRKEEWLGEAVELERLLLGTYSEIRDQAKSLLTWPGALGTYLGRLAKKEGYGVELAGVSDRRVQRYKITLKSLSEGCVFGGSEGSSKSTA
jgi:Family of unknown function (DUF5906)/Bifunctional DNA primase/polymerase, N-terminal